MTTSNDVLFYTESEAKQLGLILYPKGEACAEVLRDCIPIPSPHFALFQWLLHKPAMFVWLKSTVVRGYA
jgi:hypothetical protein